tara:strand:+ start:1333 stop:1554 length:222 start_codon:yes stop_codon:yes gene_type:complete
MKKEMLRVKDLLDKAENLLREVTQHREYYVLDRSWQWQESEKCEEYEMLTEQIETLANDIYALDEQVLEILAE